MKSWQVQEIHRLRGVAIVMIVAAHGYQFFGWADHPVVEAVFKDTFDNASLIFIFIAGFLFQFLEERRATLASRAQLRTRQEASRIPGTVPTLPLDRYAGRYEGPLGTASVTREGDSLTLHVGSIASRLEHWHYNTFRFYSSAALSLIAFTRSITACS